MARKRMIDPKFWTDDKIMDLDPLTRLLFIGIWNFADDAGVHLNNSKVLKAEIFPSDDISIDSVQKMKDQLDSLGMIKISSDRKLFKIRNWNIYQKINRPQPSKYQFDEDSVSAPKEFTPNIIKDNIIEDNKTKDNIIVQKPKKKASALKPYKNRVNDFFDNIDPEFKDLMKDSYPNIDIDKEITKAKTWLLVNTNKAKKDFKRFLNNWLSSAMESAGRYSTTTVSVADQQVLKAREEQRERERIRQLEYNKQMEKDAATPEEIRAALSKWTGKGDENAKTDED